MQSSTARLGAYKRVNVETASQGKLVVMLFNGAIQRTEEAKRMLPERKMQAIHDNLLRAQEIITELRSALDMDTGAIAQQIDRIYEYILHLLIMGNIKKDAAKLDEAVGHMTELRDTWKEAFEQAELAGAHAGAAPPPPAFREGATVMDLRG